MSPMPWRGTVIFTGTIAAVAVVAVTRFATNPAATASSADSNGSSQTDPLLQSEEAVATPEASPSPTETAVTNATATTVTITGDVVQTRYGPVQVAATFDGTTLTGVDALQHPKGHESDQINAYAIPILTEEAISVNSAAIDTVSGATFTSTAYKTSLQSAIDQLG